MLSNRLKLNADKTELIWFGTRQNLKKLSLEHINLGHCSIKLSSGVRILGVLFDSELNFNSQVSSVVKSCFFQLLQLRTIRRFLTVDAAKTLVNAFVCSRVDYCNSIYLGLSVTNHKRLQSIINSAARLITKRSRYDHISNELRSLHWLLVPHRSLYKVACIIRRSLQGKGTEYLSNHLTPVSSSTSRFHLRSASRGDLMVPRSRSVRAGESSFRVIGPRTWNSLPLSVRELQQSDSTFAKGLKTYLFSQCYANQAPLRLC